MMFKCMLVVLLVCACAMRTSAYSVKREQLVGELRKLDQIVKDLNLKLKEEEEKEDEVDLMTDVEEPVDEDEVVTVTDEIIGPMRDVENKTEHEKHEEKEEVGEKKGEEEKENEEVEEGEKEEKEEEVKEKGKGGSPININIEVTVNQKPHAPNVNIAVNGRKQKNGGGKSIFEVDGPEWEKAMEKLLSKGDLFLQGGDEVITAEQKKNEEYDNKLKGPKISKDFVKVVAWHWPKQGGKVQVPFVIDASINKYKVSQIREAVKRYAKNTCIEWKEYKSYNGHHVRFINDQGCWSFIGRVKSFKDYKGYQPISIGNGCEELGTVEHEMMHCLGFYHEQARPDRDTYVKLMMSHLANSDNARQFDKQTADLINTFGEPYDYDSIMHYGSHAFAGRTWYGKQLDTIVKKNGKHIVANRNNFSPLDLKQLNDAYKCNGVKAA